jgi:mycofactocin precursor
MAEPDVETADAPQQEPQQVLVAEDLIEEVSIDGMCGVY